MNFINDMKNNDNGNAENELVLHSLNALRNMEVIDIKNGAKIGFVKDFVIDIKESKIVSIIMPSATNGWFNKEEDLEIPWENVKRAGIDVLLIDSSEFDNSNIKNNI